MNLTISKAPLLSALKFAARVADHKSTMPSLAHLLLRVEGNKLMVAGTDLNRAAIATCEIAKAKPGALLLPAKKLVDTIAGMPDGEVTITADKNVGTLKAGRVVYQLVGLNTKDAPSLPKVEPNLAAVSGEALAAMIDRVDDAVCTDETRFHLNGANLEIAGAEWRMVTTDGHRMAVTSRELVPLAVPGPVIVPLAALRDLKAMGDGAGEDVIEVGIASPWLVARLGSRTYFAKLIDAQFPPWRQVVPKDKRQAITVGRVALHDAVRRCALMATDVRGIKLAVANGALSLSTDNPDLGNVEETLEAKGVREELAIGFAPKYALQALSAYHSDEVTIEVSGPLDPMVLRPVGADASFSVVMPMRI